MAGVDHAIVFEDASRNTNGETPGAGQTQAQRVEVGLYPIEKTGPSRNVSPENDGK